MEKRTRIDETKLLRIEQVARMLACSTRYVRQLRSEGALKTIRVGARAIRIELSEVRRFIRERRS